MEAGLIAASLGEEEAAWFMDPGCVTFSSCKHVPPPPRLSCFEQSPPGYPGGEKENYAILVL